MKGMFQSSVLIDELRAADFSISNTLNVLQVSYNVVTYLPW